VVTQPLPKLLRRRDLVFAWPKRFRPIGFRNSSPFGPTRGGHWRDSETRRHQPILAQQLTHQGRLLRDHGREHLGETGRPTAALLPIAQCSLSNANAARECTLRKAFARIATVSAEGTFSKTTSHSITPLPHQLRIDQSPQVSDVTQGAAA